MLIPISKGEEDEHFHRNINLGDVYNFFTSANKTSYIGSLLFHSEV